MPAMFSDSLFASAAIPKASRRYKTVLASSTAIQTALVAAILIVPVLHPDGLPLIRTAPATVLWKALQRPVPPPRPNTRIIPSGASHGFSPATLRLENARGSVIRQTLPTDEQAPALPTAVSGMPGASLIAAIGIPVGSTSVVRSGPGGESPRNTPLKLSSGVTAGMLIAPIRPIYPRIAIAARLQGTVVLAAIIDRHGAITALHVVSGPEMLRNAALDAVRAARYHPFLLNGEPTEVDTTISVNFTLGMA